MEIRATISELESYRSRLSGLYESMNALACQQCNEIITWLGGETANPSVEYFVKYVRIKVHALQTLLSHAETLVSHFANLEMQYAAEAQAIYDAGHYSTIYDSEGHPCGEVYVYNTAAYEAAMAESKRYGNKCSEAQKLASDIQKILDWIKNVLTLLNEHRVELSSNIGNYKSGQEHIHGISEDNKNTLKKIIDALRKYASSSRFSPLDGNFSYTPSYHGIQIETASPSSHTNFGPIFSPIFGKSTTSGGGGSGTVSIGGGCGLEDTLAGKKHGQKLGWFDESTRQKTFTGSDFKKLESEIKTQDEYENRSNKDLKKIDDEERRSLLSYSKHDMEGGTSKIINKALQDPNAFDQLPNSIKRDIMLITSGISKTQIKDTLITYRGQPLTPIMKIIGCNNYENLSESELQEAVIGKRFQQNGFTSTTINKDRANEFASAYGNVIMKIQLPKNTCGIHMGKISAYGNEIDKPETEILLQRSTNFEITNIEKKRDIYYMDVKVVGQTKYNLNRKRIDNLYSSKGSPQEDIDVSGFRIYGDE